MYDALYRTLPEFTRKNGVVVKVGFCDVHPRLNAHLATFEELPYHLVSTHTKYAPSQRHLLAPLDERELSDFFPAVLEMARVGGRLYGLPRNLDAKLLHYRRDWVSNVPETWDELCATAHALTTKDRHGFVFTGKDAGLFGMFYELSEMAGAQLFPPDQRTQLLNDGGIWALQTLRHLCESGAVPAALRDWQYDEVHRYFREGHAAMVCDWPGFYGSYCAADSTVKEKFGLARMPCGPLGIHKAYSGSHTFALTSRGADEPAAHALLKFLTSAEQQLLEARQGSVPVRRSVMEEIRSDDRERWGLLEQVMESDMLIPPRLAYYPEIEEILWRTVQQAMTGEKEVNQALREMEERIQDCHLRHRD